MSLLAMVRVSRYIRRRYIDRHYFLAYCSFSAIVQQVFEYFEA